MYFLPREAYFFPKRGVRKRVNLAFANLGSPSLTKEPCISAKEPCMSAKEPCISSKRGLLFSQTRSMQACNPRISPSCFFQKSPICLQKSPVCLQKMVKGGLVCKYTILASILGFPLSQKSPICLQKSPVCLQKSPVFPPQEAYISSKQGVRKCRILVSIKLRSPSLSKEPCISAKEPNMSAKEPNMSAKEPCMSTKRAHCQELRHIYICHHTIYISHLHIYISNIDKCRSSLLHAHLEL